MNGSSSCLQLCGIALCGLILIGCASGRDVHNYKELNRDHPRFETEPEHNRYGQKQGTSDKQVLVSKDSDQSEVARSKAGIKVQIQEGGLNPLTTQEAAAEEKQAETSHGTPSGLRVLRELRGTPEPMRQSQSPEQNALPATPTGQQVLRELQSRPENMNLQKAAEQTEEKFDEMVEQRQAEQKPTIYDDQTPVPQQSLEEDDIAMKELARPEGVDFEGDTSGTKVLWPKEPTPDMQRLIRINWQPITFAPVDGRTEHYPTYEFQRIPLGADRPSLLSFPTIQDRMANALAYSDANEWGNENTWHLVSDPFRAAFNLIALPFRMIGENPFGYVRSPYEPFEDDLRDEGW